MSDATHAQDHHPSDYHDDGPHEGPIKTPKQLVLAVVYAFVIPIAVIFLLVEFVTSSHRPNPGRSASTNQPQLDGLASSPS